MICNQVFVSNSFECVPQHIPSTWITVLGYFCQSNPFTSIVLFYLNYVDL